MYTYRIVLDAYNSRHPEFPSARVVTYSQGFNRAEALRKIGTVNIAPDGTVSDGLSRWPGTNNMPAGPIKARNLPEWDIVSMRSVKAVGVPRILAE